MLRKMLSIAIVFLNVTTFASTPVGQGSSFPSTPPNQKQRYEQYKQDNKPTRDFRPIAQPCFSNKRSSEATDVSTPGKRPHN